MIIIAAHLLASCAASLATWEAGWWLHRRMRRTDLFRAAFTQARSLNRPLVVIGAPDGGVTAGYGCGDMTIDLQPSACPVSLQADITKPLPFETNSVVVFCACVLEYVNDPKAAIRELQRVSGGYAYYVGVEPWTLTASCYPGAKQTLPPPYR